MEITDDGDPVLCIGRTGALVVDALASAAVAHGILVTATAERLMPERLQEDSGDPPRGDRGHRPGAEGRSRVPRQRFGPVSNWPTDWPTLPESFLHPVFGGRRGGLNHR